MAEQFNWLHLSDLHFGQKEQKALWSNMRDAFFDDLEKLRERCGPWQAVLFTGDLVFSGEKAQFERLESEFLGPLWEKLRELDSGDATILAVPGNHDIARQPSTPALDMLTFPGGWKHITNKFWDTADRDYRPIVNASLENYSTWWANTPYRKVGKEDNNPLLPGDFTATLEIDDHLIGIAGLNTTFLQLTGGDYEGKLALDERQFHAVCSGDMNKWVKSHDVCLLLTHQGREWLTVESKKSYDEEINTNERFAVHLFGHTHENMARGTSQNGTAIRREWQVSSLFGMDKFGEPPTYERRHGYSAGRIEFDGEKITLRNWPREAQNINGWVFKVETQARVEGDEGTRAELLPPSPRKPERTSKEPKTVEIVTAIDDSDRQSTLIPKPPLLYAWPNSYAGSHTFIKRHDQLKTLNDWASAADTRPILLFEAIGGQGKSMLTWEWTKNYAPQVRSDWAGFFWYSFYEKGAVMADFCQRALAYITQQPLETFRKKKTRELGDLLVSELQKRPWLLVLDGLERILVAYHRFDAAHIMDEEVDSSSDQMSNRNPCSAIRTEDDELLEMLRRASPSKLLITSRLTPKVLINQAHQSVPEVFREFLPGLRPEDAENLFRASGITGESQSIQNYLQSSCACHPLVIGVLAGIINNYARDPGNFDTWVSNYGDANLLSLTGRDLIQKRNHILQIAIADLSETSRQLLSTLAIIPGAITGQILEAFNPHVPTLIKEEYVLDNPRNSSSWADLSDVRKQARLQRYEWALERRKNYEQAVKERDQIVRLASQKLDETVLDLKRRGLLQFDSQTRHYDLHPVVRGFAADIMQQDEKERYGLRVVDHFSQQSHTPYEQVESLEEISLPLYVIRVLLLIGDYKQAYYSYRELDGALHKNLEAYTETVSLLKPYFPHGWNQMPDMLDEFGAFYILNDFAVALGETGKFVESIDAHIVCVDRHLKMHDWQHLMLQFKGMIQSFYELDQLATVERCMRYAYDIAIELETKEYLIEVSLNQLWHYSIQGQFIKAEETWRNIEEIEQGQIRAMAEYHYVTHLFLKGDLNENNLKIAENLARNYKEHAIIRHLYFLRGVWQAEQNLWLLAAENLREAVRMARECGQYSIAQEAWLLLAQFKSAQISEPHLMIERLDRDGSWTQLALAKLWVEMEDREQAKMHALKAHKWAWADGEPHVRRFELDKACDLLNELGVPIPSLPSYDPAKDIKHDWEDDVKAAIEELREQKRKEKQAN